MSFRVKSKKKSKNKLMPILKDKLYEMEIDKNRVLYYDQIQKIWIIKNKKTQTYV